MAVDDEGGPPLKAEQIVAALGKIGECVKELRVLPLDAILEVADREESFGCFTDPTGWSARREDVRFNRRLVEAALHLVREVTLGIQEKTRCKEKLHELIRPKEDAGGLLVQVHCPMCGERLRPLKRVGTLLGLPVVEDPGMSEGQIDLREVPGQEVQGDPPRPEAP